MGLAKEFYPFGCLGFDDRVAGFPVAGDEGFENLVKACRIVGSGFLEKRRSGRRRAFGKGVFNLWTGALSWSVETRQNQSIEYTVSANANPEAAGKSRKLSTLPSSVIDSLTIEAVIRHDLYRFLDRKILTSSEKIPIWCHVISYEIVGDEIIAGTPDVVHVDEVKVSAIHMIERKNVLGGQLYAVDRNFVGQKFCSVPNNAVLGNCRLDTPLSCFLFDDRVVAHYVTRMSTDDPRFKARRTILILDYWT